MNERLVKLVSAMKQFLPSWRVFLGLLFTFLAVISGGLILKYALRSDAKPSELDLGMVFVFCLSGLTAVLVPWERLGLRLKKVGPFEFEEVIRKQKKEQSESITFLQEQIDRLKREPISETSPSRSELRGSSPSVALPRILERFLREHRGHFFSPVRIQKWGARQQGFEGLKESSKDEISQSLLAMLAKGQVQTTISRRGNTLYGIRR